MADSDSDWTGELLRQCVKGYHCDAQNVTMCNRSLKQTAISLSSCEAARGFTLRRRVSKQGSERLRSRTEIQVEEEELQNQRSRSGQ